MKLPMLPMVATDALALASNPEASFRDIDRVIGTDAFISGKVISAANSALYDTGQPVSSLMGALNRLGMGTLRDILFQAVAEAHFFRGADARLLEEQRQHAIATAHACRLVANLIRLNTEYPFLCGLLHDIGRTVLFEKLQKSPPPELRVEELPHVVDAFHPVIGAEVARHWELPDKVAEAALHHHNFVDPKIPGGGHSQIGNLVAAAERALRRTPGSDWGPEDQCLEQMGMQEAQLAKLEQMIEKLSASL